MIEFLAASIRIADVLIAAGLDISDAAFTEEEWRATPLWCAIGRGRNLALAEHLLKLGCDPEHSLWAASMTRDHDAVRLLVRYDGASGPVPPGWEARPVTLEELTMAYLREPGAAALPGPARSRGAERSEVTK